jgi:DNA-binding NtrC family response regulator
VLLDLNYTRDTTSGEEGLNAIGSIRAFDAHTPIVAMTAWGSIELAVEAMRRGAQDFIEKPWDNERLITILKTQLALSQALQRTRALEAANRQLTAPDGDMIAESPAMQPVLETIDRIAPSDANVLITGESGCGKGLVAQIIHDQSSRRGASFVVVNIGSLAETVFESEMFGHVKGAFTDARNDRVGRFELADGGTLFLDEIANIPSGQQARLFELGAQREVPVVQLEMIELVDDLLARLSDEELGRFEYRRVDLLERKSARNAPTMVEEPLADAHLGGIEVPRASNTLKTATAHGGRNNTLVARGPPCSLPRVRAASGAAC